MGVDLYLYSDKVLLACKTCMLDFHSQYFIYLFYLFIIVLQYSKENVLKAIGKLCQGLYYITLYFIKLTIYITYSSKCHVTVACRKVEASSC